MQKIAHHEKESSVAPRHIESRQLVHTPDANTTVLNSTNSRIRMSTSMGRSCHRDSAPSTAWSAASNTDEELISVLLVCIIFFHFCFIPRGADSISSSSEAQKMEMLDDLCRIPGLLFVLSGNPEDKSLPNAELDWRSNSCPEQEHQDKNFCEIASRIPNLLPLTQLRAYKKNAIQVWWTHPFFHDFWSSSEHFFSWSQWL